MEKDGVDEKQAVRHLRRNDEDSAGFIRSFFNMDWEDSNLYDLVINTQKLSVDTGVNMILESIQSPEIKEGERKRTGKVGGSCPLSKGRFCPHASHWDGLYRYEYPC